MLYLRNFLVAKTFMDQKGGYQDFFSKTFCLTVPQNFLGAPSVSDNFWYRKFLWTAGVGGGG